MRSTVRVLVSVAMVAGFGLAMAAAASAQSRATEHTLKSTDHGPYFLIPPRDDATKRPALLVVMPGGPGTRDFLPFVENGILGAAPKDTLGVMVTAPKWTDAQKIVWPYDAARVKKMRYPVDRYVVDVVKRVQKEHRVDPRRIALLAWSSSGPVAYHLLTAKRSPFSRGYVAMSVWRPRSARALKAAKGRRFVLDQSPEDQVTAFSHVRTAFHALAKAGAIVQLSTYEGGHGWQDGPIPRLRRQLAWLFSNEKASEAEWPAGEEPIAADGNLVCNGGFERGVKRGWRTIDNSGRLTVEVDTEHKREGKQSLHLSKTGAVPLDLVVQDIDLPQASDPKAEEVVEFAVDSRTADCKNAWLKVWLYDSEGKVCNSNEDVNVARFRGTADWQRHQVRMKRGSAVRATIQCLLVLGGEVWLDDVVLRVVDREQKKD